MLAAANVTGNGYLMGSKDLIEALSNAAARLLRPLVKLLLRNGVGYEAFSEIAKRVYVDVARAEFAIPGKKQTTSRISTITGLSRKEVSRVAGLPALSEVLRETGINRAARVISGWVRDPAYHDANGEPADLPFEGEVGSFMALVKQFSGDITARTIADELTRIGAITVTGNGAIRLETRAYIPSGNELEKLDILGTDVADLIRTIDHNLLSEADWRLFQRKVIYRNLPAEVMAGLRTGLASQAQACLEEMDRTIAGTSGNGDHSARRYRAGVGIYYFEEEQS